MYKKIFTVGSYAQRQKDKERKLKQSKPLSEKFMKKSIDLYKVINDYCFQKVQGEVPPSGAIGLTKEQRTRLASMENKQDANKATYLKIQYQLLEEEKG